MTDKNIIFNTMLKASIISIPVTLLSIPFIAETSPYAVYIVAGISAGISASYFARQAKKDKSDD